MGTKLTGQGFTPTPVVNITGKVNGKFVGVLMDKGIERKMKRGKKFVYAFNVNSSDMSIQLPDASGEYKNTDVPQGTKVAVFAPTVLHKALQLATVGQTITVEYLGPKEGKNGAYHSFDVEAA